MANYLKLFTWRNIVIIYELTRRELRGKYKGSVLGFLWTFINPLAQILVYAFFFSKVLRNGIESYYVYLVVSMFPWNMFSCGLMQGLTSVRFQGDLVKKIYFKREILPLVAVLVNFVNFLISFCIIYGILLISGWGIDVSLQIYIIPIMIIEFIFTLGMAFLFSAIEVYFRDVEHIVSVILMVWMYVTPLFYSIDFVPQEYVKIFKLNPMLYIIRSYQQVLYYKVAPQKSSFLIGAICSVSIFTFGWVIFNKLEKRFAEEL